MIKLFNTHPKTACENYQEYLSSSNADSLTCGIFYKTLIAAFKRSVKCSKVKKPPKEIGKR
jgi:hypothetical protein